MSARLRDAGSLLLVFGLAVLALVGCAGGDGADGAGGADTAVATEPADGGARTGGGAATTGPPEDVASAAEAIQAELDESLAELRDVRSLDDLREDLEDTAAQADRWREQLAAVPEDPELAEERAALDQSLERLATSLEELAARAEDASPADLGALARELTPENLEGAEDVRAAVESILEQG